MELVTIIIPCYNYGWLLAETLDSVLGQTYPHWECIIIDDGSTDTTSAVAQAYQKRDSRFRYYYQANAGMSAARNHGLAIAKGNFVQFLDADDLLVPTKLCVQTSYLRATPDADLVYGDVRYFRHGAPTIHSRSFDMKNDTWMAKVHGNDEALLNTVVEKNIMVMNAPLIRMEMLRRIGNFSEDLRAMEDWEFWVRCAVGGVKFHYDATPDAWALVRIHPTSTSQNTNRMAQYEILARQQLKPLLVAAGAIQATAINNKLIVSQQSYLAAKSLTEGSILSGITAYWQLARQTGQYFYYLKSIPYWLRARMAKIKLA
jgi:GT2 family glycosyltransferase